MDQQNTILSKLNFQRVVIIIAIVMLIISLIFIGKTMYDDKKIVKWPPDTKNCCDYYNGCSDSNPTGTKPNEISRCEKNGII
jgi:hypothetical protein